MGRTMRSGRSAGSANAERPDQKTIMLSTYEEPALARRALAAGARGWVTKNDDPNPLLRPIEKVNAGGTFLTFGVARRPARTRAAKAARRPKNRMHGAQTDRNQGEPSVCETGFAADPFRTAMIVRLRENADYGLLHRAREELLYRVDFLLGTDEV